MSYTVGISSGIYIEGAKDAASYAGLSKKVYASVLYGVNFIQLDIQHLTEFLEPNLKESMEKIKKSGYSFGVHAECASFGTPVPLDSSNEIEYKMAHNKFITHIKESANINAKYVLFHSSESTPFPLALHSGYSEVRLVDPFGRPFIKFLDENPNILEWSTNNKFLEEYVFHRYVRSEEDAIRERLQDFIEKNKKEPTPEEMKKIKEETKESIKKAKIRALQNYVSSGDHFMVPDRISYPIVAKWMEITNHPLWKAYTGGVKFESIENNIEIWIPAVTAMYIAGHFDSKCKAEGGNLLDVINKYKMPVVFETPMAHQPGYELYMRLPGLGQIYKLISYINSDYVHMAVDSEHLMTCNRDPKKEIAELPARAGEKVLVIHAGAPVPYAKAHMAIEIGSDAQKYLYERLWELRQKGFRDGIIMYERAAEEGIKTSIISLRMIKKFLELDTPPKELPLEFFGIEESGGEFKRQEIAIRQHALDPLKGMLISPEEEHGFFSEAAVKKGKGKEWLSEEYR